VNCVTLLSCNIRYNMHCISLAILSRLSRFPFPQNIFEYILSSMGAYKLTQFKLTVGYCISAIHRRTCYLGNVMNDYVIMKNSIYLLYSVNTLTYHRLQNLTKIFSLLSM